MTPRDFFAAHLDDYIGELRQLVAIETPTRDTRQAELAAAFLAERFDPLGEVSAIPIDGFGPLLRIRRPGSGSRVLLLAHYDTVWPVGSWPETWRAATGRVFGPGVYDMKGGLLFILWMLRYLDAHVHDHPEIDILLDPDEEVGSLGSQRHIADAAAIADFALVLEPSNLNGSLKIARKGSGDFFVEVTGRAAHQGAEHHLGVNAVIEAAHQVLRLLELEDREAGTTVGPNVISGGVAPNTVADRARISVDVRAWTQVEQQRLERAIRGLEPVLEDASLTITGRWNRPPMEATPASLALLERARRIGGGLGLAIEGVRWGGSSDANFPAAAGAATVDGFGPTGEGSHQWNESIVVADVPCRLALLTELVVSLAQPPEEWMDDDALAALRARRG